LPHAAGARAEVFHKAEHGFFHSLAFTATWSIISRVRRSVWSIPANGLKVEQILAYYEKEQFKDWSHVDTGAPVLKAQHPEFELWNQGIHARSGVACADCHMPYKREGALKISDHHVRSPLLNINRACQTCHKWPESEQQARAEAIQERTQNMRNLAMDALVDLITDLKTARSTNSPVPQVAAAQDFQRKAQFYLDFIEAENSSGFPCATGSTARPRRVH
jgi:nitrite reductase (cytochrome c-552)